MSKCPSNSAGGHHCSCCSPVNFCHYCWLPRTVEVGQTWKYHYTMSTLGRGIETFQITAITEDSLGNKHARWSNGDGMPIAGMLASSNEQLSFVCQPLPHESQSSAKISSSSDCLTIVQIAKALNKKSTDVLLKALDLNLDGRALNINSELTPEQINVLIKEFYSDDLLLLGRKDRWVNNKTGKAYLVFSYEFRSDGDRRIEEKYQLKEEYGDGSLVVSRAELLQDFTVKLSGAASAEAACQPIADELVSQPKMVISCGADICNNRGVTMNKQQMVEKIMEMMCGADAIFGGYVRDFLAGEDFNDLDLFLFNKNDGRSDWRLKKDFIDQLIKVFGKENIRVGRNRKTYNASERTDEEMGSPIMKQTVFIKTGDSKDLQIDLVTNSKNEIFSNLDADVNGLLMRRDGSIGASKKYNLDLEQVKKHISQRVFRPIDREYDSHRIQKLIDKGYAMFAKIGQKVLVTDPNALPRDVRENHKNTLEYEVIAISKSGSVCINLKTNAGHDQHTNTDYYNQMCGWWIGPEDFKLVAEQEEKKMNNVSPNGFVGMVKDDATDAAYRIAARTMTKGMRAAALQVVRGRLESGAKVNGKINKKEAVKIQQKVSAFEELLDSDFGAALISCALGYGLTYIPMIKNDPRAKTLAKEFRVAGMATAGNAVMDIAMESFVPVILQTLQGLPEPKKIRIAEADKSEPDPEAETKGEEQEEDDYQEELVVEPRAKRAANHR